MTKVLILICAMLLGALLGFLFTRKAYSKDIIYNNAHYIANLQRLIAVNDSLSAELNRAYAETKTNKVQTKFIYITKTKEIEKQNYLKLDTPDRIKYFRRWVIDSTRANLSGVN